MNHRLWWIPALIVYYALYAHLGRKSQVDGGAWWIYVYAVGALCPIWAIVSRLTTNIIFDGLIFNVVVTVTEVVVWAGLGAAAGYTTKNVIGIVLVVVGLALVQWRG